MTSLFCNAAPLSKKRKKKKIPHTTYCITSWTTYHVKIVIIKRFTFYYKNIPLATSKPKFLRTRNRKPKITHTPVAVCVRDSTYILGDFVLHASRLRETGFSRVIVSHARARSVTVTRARAHSRGSFTRLS